MVEAQPLCLFCVRTYEVHMQVNIIQLSIMHDCVSCEFVIYTYICS